jgi:hypothetical protein
MLPRYVITFAAGWFSGIAPFREHPARSSTRLRQLRRIPLVVFPSPSTWLSLIYILIVSSDHLRGLVVRVPGYISRGPGFDYPALDILRSNVSGTGYTQPREDKWGATWKKKYRLRSRKLRFAAVGFRRSDHATPLYPRKLALKKFTDRCWSLSR